LRRNEASIIPLCSMAHDSSFRVAYYLSKEFV
jgi:predicted GNAT family acetyltransferase